MATHAPGEDGPENLPSLTQEVMRRNHIPVFMMPLARPVPQEVQKDVGLS